MNAMRHGEDGDPTWQQGPEFVRKCPVFMCFLSVSVLITHFRAFYSFLTSRLQ